MRPAQLRKHPVPTPNTWMHNVRSGVNRACRERFVPTGTRCRICGAPRGPSHSRPIARERERERERESRTP